MAPAGTPKRTPGFDFQNRELFESPKIIIFEVSGVHMGRYGLILCANESYTNNLDIGINFDLISAYTKIKNTKDHENQKNQKQI